MTHVDKTPDQIDPEGREFYIPIGTTRYRSLCRDALEKQTVRFAIAPGQSAVTHRGILTAYQEIHLSDMADPTMHPEDAMSRLVGMGVVLEKKAAK